MKKYFGNIVIQEKCPIDFRSFAYARDEDDNQWELRGYGSTVAEAAQDAWNRYADYENWDVYGYIINDENKAEN